MTSALPDAAPGNWVDRLAPPPMRPWLRLARLDRPAGIWLLMLPGWQGIALADAAARRLPDPRLLALFFAGAFLMRAAGCAYNDVVDRDIDARVARTAGRPIPSGQISARAALGFAIACCLAAFVILASLNPASAVLGVASLALVAAYPFMKRITWWPQAWLGLTFNWGVLLGFCAAQGGPSLGAWMVGGASAASALGAFAAPMWPAALLLYAAGVAWTLGYDTIYALQDLEDDALAGVKSSARRLGGSVRGAVAGFYAVALALALASGVAARLGLGFWAIGACYAVQLFRQPLQLRPADAASALAQFRANGLAGLLLFGAVAAGALTSRLPAP